MRDWKIIDIPCTPTLVRWKEHFNRFVSLII